MEAPNLHLKRKQLFENFKPNLHTQSNENKIKFISDK